MLSMGIGIHKGSYKSPAALPGSPPNSSPATVTYLGKNWNTKILGMGRKTPRVLGRLDLDMSDDEEDFLAGRRPYTHFPLFEGGIRCRSFLATPYQPKDSVREKHYNLTTALCKEGSAPLLCSVMIAVMKKASEGVVFRRIRRSDQLLRIPWNWIGFKDGLDYWNSQ